MPKHAHARNSNLKALQILRFLKELFPPEAEVRGSNPLGRANFSP